MGTNAMGARSFQVVLEWDPEDQLWVTYVPILDYLSTFWETREEAFANTKEAIIGYLEAAAKEGLTVPAGGTGAEQVSIEIPVP